MKKVVFWQKVPKFTKKTGITNIVSKRKTSFELVACQAEVVGESDPICGYCHGKEATHHRRGRRHLYSDPIGGLTLKVVYINDIESVRHNVQQGKKANCWTEEK